MRMKPSCLIQHLLGLQKEFHAKEWDRRNYLGFLEWLKTRLQQN
jgi:hypothetical protein